MFCKSSILTTSCKTRHLTCISYMFACWLTQFQEWFLSFKMKVVFHFHLNSVGKSLSVYGGSALCLASCCSCTPSIYRFTFSPLLVRATHTNNHFCFLTVFLFLWIFNSLFFYFYVFSVCNYMHQFCNLVCTCVLSGNLHCFLGRWYKNISMCFNCISI